MALDREGQGEGAMRNLHEEIAAAFDRIRGRVVKPADGFLKHDDLVPGGYY